MRDNRAPEHHTEKSLIRFTGENYIQRNRLFTHINQFRVLRTVLNPGFSVFCYKKSVPTHILRSLHEQ